jgi:hypothetical protein
LSSPEDSKTSEHHFGVPNLMQVCIELLPAVSSMQFVVRLLTVALVVFVCRLQYIHCFKQLREIAAYGEGQDRITHVLYLTGNFIERGYMLYISCTSQCTSLAIPKFTLMALT